MIIKKKKVLYLAFTFCILGCELLRNGNLDLFYFLTIFLIAKIIGNKNYYKELFTIISPLVVVVLFELLLSNHYIALLNVFITFSKIILCVSLFILVENNYKKLDTKILFTYFRNGLFLLLVCSLIFRNSTIFWRFNDEINAFSLTRLQLLYSEPATLAIPCIALAVYAFNSYLIKKSKISVVTFLVPLVCVILSYSLTAIILMIFTLGMLFVFTIFKHGKMNSKTLLLLVGLMIAVVILMITSNPISDRIFAVLSGTDGSFNYRWKQSLSSIPKIFKYTNYQGIGMGNMNTSHGLSMLRSIDPYLMKFANSFLYFVAENGVGGIIYLLYLICEIWKKLSKYKNEDSFPIRISLFIFILVLQFSGGYFTSPFIWIIYGIITSKCSENLKYTIY